MTREEILEKIEEQHQNQTLLSSKGIDKNSFANGYIDGYVDAMKEILESKEE